jgi:DNA-binding SARP family transcriptional activator
MLIREGDTYRLVVPPGSEIDLRAFDQALNGSRRARLAGDSALALEAFEHAAAIAENELLPEDGSADWVIRRRDRIRAGLLDVARPLAKHLLADAQPALAARVSETALNADRYDDGLWRTLIEAHEQAGDEAGVRRAQSEYRRIVLELEPRTTRS